jgi:rhamnulokinase
LAALGPRSEVFAMNESAYAAVDLGAESGRVVIGRIAGGRASLELVHRFPNSPVRLPDGLHWDLLGLFAEVLRGLRRASSAAPLCGVGVDAWGVDYALLDRQGRVLGLPFHYRDPRTEGMVARAHDRVASEDLYAVTGIQTMAINTAFQLLAEERSSALAIAERVALIPDLFAFWLTGDLANEATVASTTGLLDARTGKWARETIGRLGLPTAPFSKDPIEPGTTLGSVLADHGDEAGPAAGAPVHLVASHDTASAFAAAPLRGPRAAIVSSGTWSLVGMELDGPILTPEACAANLTNERGIDGTTRLLRNVMGLWLIQECRRQWTAAGRRYDYAELQALAAAARRDVPLFDPDEERLLAPGDMPARIAAACRAAGQAPPETPGAFARSVLVSLACKYRFALQRLERVSGHSADVLHVVGGGARNELLCRFTADITGLPVLAGPVEATAVGNVLTQARATGELGSLSEMREVASRTADVTVYEPGPDRAESEDAYGRFLSLTGADVKPPEGALA